MNLTYEVNGNGYTIFKDGKPWIAQNGYIPYPGATVEESAQNHIDAIIADNEAPSAGQNELEVLKTKVDLQEQALAELTMYISTLGI